MITWLNHDYMVKQKWHITTMLCKVYELAYCYHVMSNIHVVISIPKTKIYFFLDVGVNSLRTTARKTCSKF